MTLHLLSLAPAAVGLCCLAADRRRSRALELFAALVMMLAMTDAALTRLVAPVWWCVLLLATAVALAAVRGRARSRGSVSTSMVRSVSVSLVGAGAHGRGPVAAGGGAGMAVHAAGGLVVMAALLLAMAGDAGSGVSAGWSGSGGSAAHRHGAPVAGVPAVGAVLAIAYVVGSILLMVRTRRSLDRAQFAAMAASVALMSLGLAVPASS